MLDEKGGNVGAGEGRIVGRVVSAYTRKAREEGLF